MMTDEFLLKKLNERLQENAFRRLTLNNGKVDFCSNDYLGVVYNNLLHEATFSNKKHGSTGSRLLAGNYPFIEEVEKELAVFHDSEAALIYNSGYDANVGLISCIAQRGDTIIYDQLVHASIRDGIRLSFAQSFPFPHNDIQTLEHRLQQAPGNIFVVTESVFSMDGDLCQLQDIISLCATYKAHLILDEAHGLGVIGEKGEGLAQHHGLHAACFARMYTFGKAAGCHGAVIVGSKRLKEYLVNFSRSFIFSTALPEVAVWAIQKSYATFSILNNERKQLSQLIAVFQAAQLRFAKLKSDTPIQVIQSPGNSEAKALAEELQQHNMDVRAILYPTVPRGGERLRIVLHSFNTLEQVQQLIYILS
jgi:8-amino-7-oxononanoate synthase